MDVGNLKVDKTNITMFSGCRVFRFNHFPKHDLEIAGRFKTFAVNYAHSGSIEWSVDGSPAVILRAPVVYWTWPGPHYCYRPASGDHWDHYFVSWEGPRSRSWKSGGLIPDVAPQLAIRAVSDPSAIRSVFSDLHTALGESPPDDPLVVHLLEGLLLRIQQQRAAIGRSTLQAEVEQIVSAVRARPHEAWDFDVEAERVGCTTVHLRRLWKSLTGMPPNAFVNKTRLDRAAALLRANRLTLMQIAEDVGYYDVGYFSRLFRRAYGQPPGAYRRNYQSVM